MGRAMFLNEALLFLDLVLMCSYIKINAHKLTDISGYRVMQAVMTVINLYQFSVLRLSNEVLYLHHEFYFICMLSLIHI